MTCNRSRMVIVMYATTHQCGFTRMPSNSPQPEAVLADVVFVSNTYRHLPEELPLRPQHKAPLPIATSPGGQSTTGNHMHRMMRKNPLEHFAADLHGYFLSHKN